MYKIFQRRLRKRQRKQIFNVWVCCARSTYAAPCHCEIADAPPPTPRQLLISTNSKKNKIEMKKRNIRLTSGILLLSLILHSCRTVKESDCLTHQTRIGIDSCVIAHDLSDIIKKSDITTSITLHEYVMNEQGDTAIIRHYDIRKTQSDTISQHKELIKHEKTSTSINDSICSIKKTDKGTSSSSRSIRSKIFVSLALILLSLALSWWLYRRYRRLI